MYNFILLIFLLTVSLRGFGAGVQSDDFKIGKNGSSANKRLQLGTTGEIRYNESDGKVQFSHNGTDFKNIGSGGASGGDNLLVDDNPDFEGGVTGWTLTGAGTFAAETSAPLNGAKSAKFNASASGEKVCSTLKLIKSGYQGRACQVDLPYYQYASGSAGDYELNVYNGEGVEIATVPLAVTTSTATARAFQTFDCPALNGGDDSDQIQMCVESTADGGDILWDDSFLGQGRNEVSTSQTVLVASAHYQATSSCIWSRTSSTFGTFTNDTDCPGITVQYASYAVDASDRDQPDILISNLPAGVYYVELVGHVKSNTASQVVGLKILEQISGTVSASECGRYSTEASNVFNVKCSAVFDFSTPGNRRFNLQAFEGGGNTVTLHNELNGLETSWTVWRVPKNTADAVTLETSGEYWDANIGGAHVDLGTSNQASYIGMENSGLDMVLAEDSAPAEIPCSSTNASTGLTCAAGSESVGIAFTIKTAGRYEVCATFSHNAAADNAGFVSAAFQLVETPNNAQNILQEGRDKPTSSPDNGTGASIATTSSHHTCSYFKFSSVGKKTVRLFYEQQVAATLTTNLILADRSTSVGQRDIHIVVRKDTQQTPTPVFTNLTNSLNKKIESLGGGLSRIESCQITFPGGVPTISDVSGLCGGWISSLSDTSTGRTGINFTGAPLASEPNCQCTPQDQSTSHVCVVNGSNASAVTVDTFTATTTTLADIAFGIWCHFKE